MQKPSIDIIIPNWNGKELLQKNLPGVMEALRHVPCPFKTVTVVDDGSDDGSAAWVMERYPEIHLILNPKNRGFHFSINRGVKESQADLVLLLNSDVYPEPTSFYFLYECFLKKPGLFAVSGKFYSDDRQRFLYGNRGGTFQRGHFYLHEKIEEDRSQTLFVSGGGGLFERRRFLELGGFDTLYSPFYYEEQDISYRALKRGWEITYEPQSRMYHQIQVSIGKKMKRSRIRLISARNNYLFVLKNITDFRWTLASFFFTPIMAVLPLFRGNPRFFLALLLCLPRIPKALWKRLKEHKHSIVSDRVIFQKVNEFRRQEN